MTPVLSFKLKGKLDDFVARPGYLSLAFLTDELKAL